MEFELVWRSMRSRLVRGMELKNWTVLKGYLGDTIRIEEIGQDYILVQAPNARYTQRVHRDDFEEVWNVWGDYKIGRLQRQELTPLTRYSKYVISILHWWEGLQQ